MTRRLRRSGIALSALALASGGAAGLAGGAGAAPVRSPRATASPTDTPAARLRAALDQLLREHVDLTAVVVQTAVTTGPTSAATRGAEAALGQNTDALGAAFGSIYGPAAKAEFLKLWRAHIGYFVDYTLGIATNSPAKVAAAQRDLDGYVHQFATFVSGVTRLPVGAVTADLRGHVATLEAAIRAIVTKRPAAGTAVGMAAAHMDGTAQVLAGGIARSKGIAGNPSSAASDLRSALTGLLIQHVADTGFVVQTALAAKGNLHNPEVAGAIRALDTNTDALGAAFGSIYGPAAKAEFLTLWRAHIGFFVDYTLGKATGNAAEVATAQRRLNGYVASFSHFVSGATHLPATAVAADLRGHIATLETAIDALVAGSPTAATDLSAAETHMAGTAAVLSTGIVAAKPAAFGG